MTGRYVALLRGINVGRAKRVSMADLRALMERLGFHDCRTLLNSGNVVFSGGARSAGAESRIEQALPEATGVAARVFVLAAGELSAIVEENRLPAAAADPTRVLVAFVRQPSDLERLAAVGKQSWKPEALAIGTRAAYLWCPAGVGKSPLAEAVNRALADRTTARNWATVKKLQELL